MIFEMLGTYAHAREAIPETDEPTPAPGDEILGFNTHHFMNISTYIAYDGEVSSGVLRLWLFDGDGWYKGASLDLTSSDGDSVYDWEVGRYRSIAFQVESISGGGRVTVKVQGV